MNALCVSAAVLRAVSGPVSVVPVQSAMNVAPPGVVSPLVVMFGGGGAMFIMLLAGQLVLQFDEFGAP